MYGTVLFAQAIVYNIVIIGAGYLVAKEMMNPKHHIPREEDRELVAADEKDAERNRIIGELLGTTWDDEHWLTKLCMVFSFIFLWFCMYVDLIVDYHFRDDVVTTEFPVNMFPEPDL